MLRLLTPVIIVFFIISGLSLPTARQQEDNSVGLRNIIQQVQSLSGQSDSLTLNFAHTFRSTLTTLQAVAGLKTIISKKSTKDGSNASTVIICINLPFLLQPVTDLDVNISGSDLDISKRLIVDTSIILSLDNPPPIA